MTTHVESFQSGLDAIGREAALLLFASESETRPHRDLPRFSAATEVDRERADLLAGIAARLGHGYDSDEIAAVHHDLLRHLMGSSLSEKPSPLIH